MTSTELFARACQVIPGGVNSPVRAFNAVGGNPVFMTSGKGATLTTADGDELTDYCGSWGPLILGHTRAEVVAAVTDAASKGMTFGACTASEVDLAEFLCVHVPGMDKVRLVSSGTEAVMTALRVARGCTGRNAIVKFEGCYHGHSDSLLVSAGSGVLTGGMASSAGVAEATAADTFVVPYNDIDAVNSLLDARGAEIAAIIVEPVAGNMGLVQPAPGFLQGLRDATNKCGALLIFDEVITGFRLAATTYGAQCGVEPDLTCLGKIIGGGMPIGGVGGKGHIMDKLAPLGPVYQAGTLSGNPVAVAAGLTTLRLLEQENPYPEMARLGKKLADAVNAAATSAGVAMHVAQLGGAFTPFFTNPPVTNLTDAKRCDTDAHGRFFHGMLQRGVYLPPSQFEVGFVSAVHTDADIDRFIEAASAALAG